MASVLLVTSDSEGARQLAQELSRIGYTLALATNAQGALESMAAEPPEALLLDLALYPLLSWEVRQLLKKSQEGASLPVVALVPEPEVASHDFFPGIDDFVVSPARPFEVVARLKQALRRRKGLDSEGLLHCGDLTIDPDRFEVTVAGTLVDLTYKEYELLRFLATNRGKVFTREALLNRVWGYDYYGGARTVDVHIRRLRSKLEDGDRSFIETVRNVGYRFKAG